MVGRTPEVAFKKCSALLSLNKLQFSLAVGIIALSFICGRQVFPSHVVWRQPAMSLLSLDSFLAKLSVWAVCPELFVAFALWVCCKYVDLFNSHREASQLPRPPRTTTPHSLTCQVQALKNSSSNGEAGV